MCRAYTDQTVAENDGNRDYTFVAVAIFLFVVLLKELVI